MKKISFLLIALLFAITYSSAQKKWAVKVGAGLNKVHDETAKTRGDILSMGIGSLEIGVGYSFNPYIGLELNGDFHHLRLNDFNYQDMTTNAANINLEVDVNFSNIIQSLTGNQKRRRLTFKGHFGPGASGFKADNSDEMYIMPNIKLGGQALYRFGKWGAGYIDFTSRATLEQGATYDGLFKPTNTPANAYLNTWTIGIKGYLNWGKSNREIEIEDDDPYHYDWHITKKEEDSYYITEEVSRDTITFVYNNYNIYFLGFTIVNSEKERDAVMAPPDQKLHEMKILFSHDKSTLWSSSKQKLDQLAAFMKRDSNYVVTLEGWASPTGSNSAASNAYNRQLSYERADAAANYLMSEHGIHPKRIRKVGHGKDFDKKDDHPGARCVTGFVQFKEGGVWEDNN
jgi:outer membrane protein OmpA-like peptidoglycan-associated protein